MTDLTTGLLLGAAGGLLLGFGLGFGLLWAPLRAMFRQQGAINAPAEIIRPPVAAEVQAETSLLARDAVEMLANDLARDIQAQGRGVPDRDELIREAYRLLHLDLDGDTQSGSLP